MSEQKHTPEPWEIEGQEHDAHTIVNSYGIPVCQLWHKDESPMVNQDANAARIVVCVNALAGIENPEEWVKEAKILMDNLGFNH